MTVVVELVLVEVVLDDDVEVEDTMDVVVLP